MGIIISPGNRHPGSIIVPIVVRLECDEATEIFCRGFQDFTSPEGFIGARRKATEAGWTERKDGEHRWVCPTCSGK